MGSGIGWGMGFGGFFMILFWVVIVAAVVMLVKWLFGGSSRIDLPRGKSALEILQERYARGEIGKEEFEQKKRDLE
ncbi:MAG: SHOCT domain-containing protein [Sulfuricaulis sp.]